MMNLSNFEIIVSIELLDCFTQKFIVYQKDEIYELVEAWQGSKSVLDY